MRAIQYLLFPALLLSAFTACRSTALVSRAVRDADLGPSIVHVRSDRVWRPSEPGRGLQVSVRVEREASDYRRDLVLELDGAAKVCSTLARIDPVGKFAYVNVLFSVSYRGLPGAGRSIVGVAEVIIRKKALKALRDQDAPASEFPVHWRFLAGYKDQPDSKELLTW